MVSGLWYLNFSYLITAAEEDDRCQRNNRIFVVPCATPAATTPCKWLAWEKTAGPSRAQFGERSVWRHAQRFEQIVRQPKQVSILD